MGGVLAAPVAVLVVVRRLPARPLVPVVRAIVSLFALRNL